MQPEDFEFDAGIVKDCLSPDTLEKALSALPDWQAADAGPDGIQCLVANYTFDNFVAALAFTNRVGELAEQYNHHPRIILEYGRVSVSWWTHTAGGISVNDVVLARETSTLKAAA